MENKIHWLEDGESDYENTCRANSLIEEMRNIETTDAAIHRQNLFGYQLYSNRFLAQFDWGTGYYTRASLEPVSSTTDNVVVEVVDAVIAEVGKNRPKIKPVCHGASYGDRQIAQKLDKFLWGEFIRNDVYEVAKATLLNAAICKFGCIKVCTEDTKQGTKIKLESVFPDEILINQAEVIATNEIRTVYRRRVLPVEVVCEMYDVEEEDLKVVDTIDYVDYRTVGKGYVVVGEVYKVGGKHVVATHDKILFEEDWDHDWLPYVFFHYNRRTHGFYTQSLVELVLPDQIRLNKINAVIEEAQALFCSGKLLVQHGSKISRQSLDNEPGRVITYTGTEPKAVTWPAISPELYAERDRIKAGAFTKVGINQMASSGNLPPQARLDSSPAVRELNAVQDSRLSDLIQRYEKLFVDLATTMVKVLNTLGKGATTVWFPVGNKRLPEEIKWKDVDLDEKSYTMTLEPSSSFAMTPSAIRDDLENKVLRGEITMEQYHEQLRQYDPDAQLSILAASSLAINAHQEKLANGEAILPDRNMDLVSGIKQITAFYNYLIANFPNQEEKELVKVQLAVLNWLEAAKAFTNEASQPSLEQSMAPPIQPQPIM